MILKYLPVEDMNFVNKLHFNTIYIKTETKLDEMKKPRETKFKEPLFHAVLILTLL